MVFLLACGWFADEEEPVEASPQHRAALGCQDPESVRFPGHLAASGYVRCADRSWNRVRLVDVPFLLDRCEDFEDTGLAANDCNTDAGCGSGEFCWRYATEPFAGFYCSCRALPCVEDQDCGERQACFFGECVEANCATDDDCPTEECGVWSEYWGGSDVYGTNYGLRCRIETDECRDGNEDTCECGEDFDCVDD